jgi:hypothetical protein
MSCTLRRLGLLIGLFAMALVVSLLYTALPVSRAVAQTSPGLRIVRTGGPIQLANGERALIGLLLPAVQNLKTPFRLTLWNNQGTAFIELPLRPPTTGRVFPAFFDVLFGDGSVRVFRHGDTTHVLFTGRLPEGHFAAVLLPAVQSNGDGLGALASSIQLIQDGQVKHIIQMCDGSV